jgi:hypothetical protein
VVKELENNKVIHSRSYATTVAERDATQIRTGSRVPYATSSFNPGPGGPANKQVNYYDVGVNIDSRQPRLVEGKLALNVNADISSVVVSNEAATDLPPVIRSTKWSSPVVVPLKKPTTIFSSDDPTGNRKMQLELTATPIP